jgi:hypothetical protein
MTKREFAKLTQTRTREVAKSVRYGCTVAKNGTTVCVDTLTGKVGIARLHPDDDYVFETGVAIAYARCKGIEIPKVSTYKKLSEMKNGENFVDMFGNTFRYVAKDKDVFVVWNYDFKKYSVMLCDVEYEIVD